MDSIDDALVRFEKYERKMEPVEGRVEAYDLSVKKDLRREIDYLESEESVEEALDALKKRIGASDGEQKQA